LFRKTLQLQVVFLCLRQPSTSPFYSNYFNFTDANGNIRYSLTHAVFPGPGTGELVFRGATFNFKATNKVLFSGNVGIGTLTPSAKLEVKGGDFLLKATNNDPGDVIFQKSNGSQMGRIWTNEASGGRLHFSSKDNTADMTIDYLGRVGIGTLTPKGKLNITEQHLDIYTSAGTSSGFTKDGLTVRANPDQGYSTLRIKSGHGPNTDRGLLNITRQENSLFYVRADGNVGIGTPTPQNKLSVNGHIWAKEIKVKLTDGADWVFEDNYYLRPLSEVAEFIAKNKHLPEIPSADDFRKNDLKVSEMTNKLLQKIEELTLYAIEQEKLLQLQEEKNKSLEERLAKLELLLN